MGAQQGGDAADPADGVQRIPQADAFGDTAHVKTLAVLCDVSGSMHDKIDNVKRRLPDFVKRMDAVSLVVFNAKTDLVIKHARVNQQQWARALSSVGIPDEGGTDIVRALCSFIPHIGSIARRSNHMLHVLVITDGMHDHDSADFSGQAVERMRGAYDAFRDEIDKRENVVLCTYVMDLDRQSNVQQRNLHALRDLLQAEARLVPHAMQERGALWDRLGRQMVAMERIGAFVHRIGAQRRAIEATGNVALVGRVMEQLNLISTQQQEMRTQTDDLRQQLGQFQARHVRGHARPVHSNAGEVTADAGGAAPPGHGDEKPNDSGGTADAESDDSDSLDSERAAELVGAMERHEDKHHATLAAARSETQTAIRSTMGAVEELQGYDKEVAELQEQFTGLKDEVEATSRLKQHLDREVQAAASLHQNLDRAPADGQRLQYGIDKEAVGIQEMRGDPALPQPLRPTGEGECQVCFGEGVLWSATCASHQACKDCWKEHVTEEIRSNCVPVSCLGDHCDRFLTDQCVEYLLEADPGTVQAYQERIRVRRAQQEGDVHFCPEDCGNALCRPHPSEQRRITCEKCRVDFCLNCKRRFHFHGECALVARARTAASTGDEVRRMADNLRSEIAALEGAVLCPQCKVPVQRREGCFSMRCRCGKAFCIKCGDEHVMAHLQFCLSNRMQEVRDRKERDLRGQLQQLQMPVDLQESKTNMDGLSCNGCHANSALRLHICVDCPFYIACLRCVEAGHSCPRSTDANKHAFLPYSKK
eukprot:TRINITY_DN42860_c0_g1_i1.p1 TRINITY_DN42860_c0_g1~~TRINITY_DN42860_c0_g1_i1.p1  ORF type:complete len:762 (+),score=177.11 TRINITY_DN42860_c0_g1_i1:81-2366(+)